MSTAIQTEATAIVHAGLADILAQLGETPSRPHEPRHAAPLVTFEIRRACDKQAYIITTGGSAA